MLFFMLFMPTKVAGGFVKLCFYPASQVIFDKYMFHSGASQSTSAYVDDNVDIVHCNILRTTTTSSFVRVNQIFPKTSSAHLEIVYIYSWKCFL